MTKLAPHAVAGREPIIYISYGVPKSASTFTQGITEAVLRAAGYAPAQLSEAAKGNKSRLNYMEAVSWKAIERASLELGEQSTVIKTHSAPDKELLKALERGEIFASAVVRDPREIALSLLDHGRRSRKLGIKDFAEIEQVTDAFKVLDTQFKWLATWAESSKVLLLSYDQVCFDTIATIQKIIDQLGLHVSATTVLETLPKPEQVRQFNKGVRNRYETEMPEQTQRLFLQRYATVYERYLMSSKIMSKTRLPKEKPPMNTQAAADKFRWFHSIDLGNGVVTKGLKTVDHLRRQADTVFKHGIAGKTVLDIGAWDGALSFEAERRGAARVLATDHFCWTGDGWGRKAPFDFAHRALNSTIESKVIDLPEISREAIGEFDVVLFLGVFYHLLHPLLRLESIAPVAKELLVLDTDTALDDEDRPAMVFFPGKELNNDATNWWAPNIKCVKAMLRHLGFKRIEVSPTWPYDGNINHKRGRFTFHAWR